MTPTYAAGQEVPHIHQLIPAQGWQAVFAVRSPEGAPAFEARPLAAFCLMSLGSGPPLPEGLLPDPDNPDTLVPAGALQDFLGFAPPGEIDAEYWRHWSRRYFS